MVLFYVNSISPLPCDCPIIIYGSKMVEKNKKFLEYYNLAIQSKQQFVQNGSIQNQSAIDLHSWLDLLEYLFLSYHTRLSGYLGLVLAK